MMNKKGLVGIRKSMDSMNNLFKIVLLVGLLVVVALVIWGITALSNMEPVDPTTIASIQIGDAIGVPAFNFLSYIAGGVPNSLISSVGDISATIIVLALFVMILITFADILGAFSMFSKSTSLVIGIALAIIMANLKFVMLVAVWSFAIVGGLGILSVIVGVAVPFLIFLVLNIVLGSQLKAFASKKDAAQKQADITAGTNLVTGAIGAFKDAANKLAE